MIERKCMSCEKTFKCSGWCDKTERFDNNLCLCHDCDSAPNKHKARCIKDDKPEKVVFT